MASGDNWDGERETKLTYENVKKFTDNLGLFDRYRGNVLTKFDEKQDWGLNKVETGNTQWRKLPRGMDQDTNWRNCTINTQWRKLPRGMEQDTNWRYSTIKTSPSASGTTLIRHRAPCYTNKTSFPQDHQNCVVGPVQQWMDYSWGSSGHIQRWLSQVQVGYVPDQPDPDPIQDVGTIPSPKMIRKSNLTKSRPGQGQGSNVWNQISKSRGIARVNQRHH